MRINCCCTVNDGLAVTAYLVVQTYCSCRGLIMHGTLCHFAFLCTAIPMLIPSKSNTCRWLDLRDCFSLVSLPTSMLHNADSSRHFCPLPAWRTAVLEVVPHQSSTCQEKKCNYWNFSDNQVLRGILGLFAVVNAGQPLNSSRPESRPTTTGNKDPHQNLRVACHALQDMCLQPVKGQ